MEPEHERRLERALRRAFPDPSPRTGFRVGLRERFVSGRFAVEAGGAVAPVGLRPRRVALRLLAGGLAAAALILVVARLVPRAERWRAVEVAGEVITLDGRAVRVADLAELGPAIMAAEVVDMGETRVSLELPGRFRLQAEPGARFRPGALAGAERGSPSRLELEAGEVFLWKNPDGGDGPCTVSTPDVDVAVVGTVVGVMRFEGGTCVCVERGHASVSCCQREVPPEHSHIVRPGLPCQEHPFSPGCRSCPVSGSSHTHECRLVHFAQRL